MSAACIAKVFVVIIVYLHQKVINVQFTVKICLVSTEGRSFVFFARLL